MPEKLSDIAMNIKFDAVRAHLQVKHWEESQSIYGNLAIFSTVRDGQKWRIKVPRERKQDSVYADGVADAIATLAALDDEDPFALATLLRREVVDIHRLHLPPSIASLLSAPVVHVQESLNAFSELLHEAMYEEADVDPKAAAAVFRSSCQFGHTFSGSFGLSIEAPINVSALALFPDEAPTNTPERSANLRISRGLGVLAEAGRDGSYQMLHDGEAIGLTTAMCKSLLRMAPVIHSGNVEYEAYWSPFLRNESPTQKVRFPAGTVELLERAVHHAAPVPEDLTIEFTGSIEKLQASREDLLEADPSSKCFKFGIRGRSPQTGNCMLTFLVEQAIYRQALAYHEQKTEVEAVCKVRRRTRGWVVQSLESLRPRSATPPMF